MTLRFPFRPSQLLSLFAVLALTALRVEGQQAAADTVTMADGRQQAGKIIGVSGTNLQIQIGQGTIGLPLAGIKSVTMQQPPEVNAAIQAFESRDFPKALALLRGLEKWKGVPAEWAQQVTAMVGDVLVEMNDLAKAEVAYKEFQRVYPGGQASTQADVGMARLAVGKKDYATAKLKLEAVAKKALEEKNPPRALVFAYSQAFYLLGQVKEAEGNHEAALEDYLRTVTLFYHDRATVALAQEKADALRKSKKVAVP